MTAGHKGVSGRSRVHVEGGLATQPQRNVRADRPTERALPAGAPAGPFLSLPVALGSLPPVVSAVDVAAGEVSPRLTLLQTVAAGEAGEGQRAQTHGALRASRVQLQAEGVQVAQGGRFQQAFSRAPQQRGTTEIHQRAVPKSAAFALSLR